MNLYSKFRLCHFYISSYRDLSRDKVAELEGGRELVIRLEADVLELLLSHAKQQKNTPPRSVSIVDSPPLLTRYTEVVRSHDNHTSIRVVNI